MKKATKTVIIVIIVALLSIVDAMFIIERSTTEPATEDTISDTVVENINDEEPAAVIEAPMEVVEDTPAEVLEPLPEEIIEAEPEPQMMSDGLFCIDYTDAGRGIFRIKGDGGVIAVLVHNASGEQIYKAIISDNNEFVPVTVTTTGECTFSLYKQNDREKYDKVLSVTANIECDARELFLSPTYCVDYREELKKITETISGENKALAIKEYVKALLDYDYDKAEKIMDGTVKHYRPDIESILSSRKGICYDYASLYAALCRAEGIPCKLIKGVTPEGSHAWNEVLVGDEWVFVDCTMEDGGQLADSYTKTGEY